MIGLGTIVNAAAIIAGGVAGSFAGKGLPEKFKNTIMQAISLSVLIIGFSGTLQGIFRVKPNGEFDKLHIITMIFSLVIGGLAGELIDIEQKLDRLGAWFQRKLVRGENRFAEGFVTASLIYCVGAMAIVGSLEDGLTGNAATLFAKSILDGVTAIIFAATLGIGVAFSSFPVLVYQGGITLLAGIVKPLLTDTVISQMSLVGSVLIIGISFNMLDIRRIKVGNLLPAIFVPFIYHVLSQLVG